ncbi:MAG: SDR family NAD(P)-dependent oxidoreductase [Myxococcales bacterium]|nr:SDR family NAD(P)-dependent oxidoreductase [Myxococcales bacterium]
MSERGKGIVVGVGAEAGVGGAVCKRLAREGLQVFVAGRTADKIGEIERVIKEAGGAATPVVTDTTLEDQVIRLFDVVRDAGPGKLEIVVYNAGNNRFGNFREMEVGFFEEVWRVCCLGGFLVGREAARRMLPAGGGTLIFTGATASIRGRPPFTAFASAKAGLRAIAQSMAREFGPQGLHVAHSVIDGAIRGDQILKRFPEFAERKGEGGMLEPEAIAETYWQLHRQHATAWTHELDLRPAREPF